MAKLTIIAGEAGAGKTTHALDMMKANQNLIRVDEAEHPGNWEAVGGYLRSGYDVVACLSTSAEVEVINLPRGSGIFELVEA